MDITKIIAAELGKDPVHVENIIRLLDEGNTVPFIARYRKELHGAMDDQAIRTLARSRGVPLIDLYAMSFRAISDMGDEASRCLYMNVAPGEYPGYPDGQQDNVHTRYEGAALYARMVADALREMKLL